MAHESCRWALSSDFCTVQVYLSVNLSTELAFSINVDANVWLDSANQQAMRVDTNHFLTYICLIMSCDTNLILVVLFQSDCPLWGIGNKKCAIHLQDGIVGYLNWVMQAWAPYYNHAHKTSHSYSKSPFNTLYIIHFIISILYFVLVHRNSMCMLQLVKPILNRCHPPSWDTAMGILHFFTAMFRMTPIHNCTSRSQAQRGIIKTGSAQLICSARLTSRVTKKLVYSSPTDHCCLHQAWITLWEGLGTKNVQLVQVSKSCT